jgi:hypothetical protein
MTGAVTAGARGAEPNSDQPQPVRGGLLPAAINGIVCSYLRNAWGNCTE